LLLLCYTMNQTQTHYSINLKKRLTGQSDICIDDEFQVKGNRCNVGITNLKLLLTPINNGAILYNIENSNSVTNTKSESVVFTPGYYTLAEIFATINTMTYNQIQLITSPASYGKCQVISPIEAGVTMDLTNAPDLKQILGYNSDTVLTDGAYSDNIIDITRNNQVILVYASFVRSNDLRIANQKNCLLTTINVDDPEKQNVHKLQDVWIPIQRQYQRVYLSFRNGDNQPIKLWGDFELQAVLATDLQAVLATDLQAVLATDLQAVVQAVVQESKPSEVQSSRTSQFSLYQVLTSSTTDVQLENPLNFKGCYISEIDVFTDFELHNVTSTQTVLIYGNHYDYSELTATVVIPEGMYSIEQILALLNCSDALFQLIYHGANAFRVTISDFSHIVFTQAQEIKAILGIDSDTVVETEAQELRYPVTSTCNTIVVNVNNVNSPLEVQTGNYTWSEFIGAISEAIGETIGFTSVSEHDSYVEFNGSVENWYFNRASQYSTIHYCYWLKHYRSSAIQCKFLEKPDMNIMSSSFNDNSAFTNDVKYMVINSTGYVTDSAMYYFQPSTTVSYKLTKYNQASWVRNGTYSFEGRTDVPTFVQNLMNAMNTSYGSTGYKYTLRDGINIISNKASEARFELTFNSNYKIYNRAYQGGTMERDFFILQTNIEDLLIFDYNFTKPVTCTVNYTIISTGVTRTLVCVVPAAHYTSDETFIQAFRSAFNTVHSQSGLSGYLTYYPNGLGPHLGGSTGDIKVNSITTDYHETLFYLVGTTTSTNIYPRGVSNKVYMELDTVTSMYKWDKTVPVPTETQTITIAGDGLLNQIVQLAYQSNIGVTSWDATNGGIDITMARNIVFNFYNASLQSVTPGWSNTVIARDITTGNNRITFPDTLYKESLPQCTMIYTKAGGSKTATISAATCTQQAAVAAINAALSAANIDAMWVPDTTGYKCQLLGGTVSGSLFDQDFFGVDNCTVTANYILWLYQDKVPDSVVDTRTITRSTYISPLPVDITQGLSQLKLYTNIVHSKADQPLLSLIEIGDLSRNWFKHDRLCIPCNERLDKITFRVSNLDDKAITFNGNIHLLVLFKAML